MPTPNNQLPTAKDRGSLPLGEPAPTRFGRWKLGVGSYRRTVSAALLIALTVPSISSQEKPQRAPGTVREGVTAVLVDVVVRDKRGQPVRDLTATDFEILEDGQPQTLGSFTLFSDGGAPARTAATAPANAPSSATLAPAPASSDAPGVTALVFHPLSPDSRRRAVQAARGYVGGNRADGGELHRRLRPRSVPVPGRAIHAQRRRRAAGTRADGDARDADREQSRATARAEQCRAAGGDGGRGGGVRGRRPGWRWAGGRGFGGRCGRRRCAAGEDVSRHADRLRAHGARSAGL